MLTAISSVFLKNSTQAKNPLLRVVSFKGIDTGPCARKHVFISEHEMLFSK